MITAHSALSIRRRGSRSSGKNEPLRSFGIPTVISPAGVDTSLSRCPFRRFDRAIDLSLGSAPIRADRSASISDWIASVRISAKFAANGESVAPSDSDSAFRAESWLVIVRCSSQFLGRF